ncbi:MAG: sugar ABC transporter ATP-binding protein [Verrucomicrobiia bacterium]
MLQVLDVSKSFPGIRALDRVRLDVSDGTVHALVGENGAGKSTLMKIVAGLIRPDEGELLFKGQRFRPRNPHDALKAGIAMIPQELMPFRELTVAENIFVGHEPILRFGWLDKDKMQREAARLLGQIGVVIPPTARMKDLTVAQMQVVEIAKALAHNADLLIMDEPTSAISEREVETLFSIIGGLKRRGVSVIYVSHRLDEIFRIADVVTVLRDGQHVATRPITDVDRNTLIALMVGRDIEETVGPPATATGQVALELRGLTKRGKFTGVDLTLRQGEILGLAGLMGAGRTELAEAIFGLVRPDGGEVRVHGRVVKIESPRDAIAHGIGMVTEDRHKFGLVHVMSVKHNITLADLPGWWINRRAENAMADEQLLAYSIKARDRNQLAGTLSGGNQQKVVLAKTLLPRPSILILDEPTRGIDIGSKAEMHAFVRKLAREGMAVLLISSELPELLCLSTRLLVMRQGRICAELDPRSITQETVLRHAMPKER